MAPADNRRMQGQSDDHNEGGFGLDDERNAVPDADAAIVEGHAPPSARRTLNRGRVIAAALRYVDEFGLTALTMRRLGEELNVEAMSLYRYVPGKEQLLDGIVESLIAEMQADPNVLQTPRHGWQDFLQRLAHGVRRIALAHPLAFPLVASRPPEAPWLRPPLRSIHWVEIFLSGLLAEGFDDEAAVDAYRAFTSFLLGHLLLEVSTHGAEVGALDVVTESPDAGSTLSQMPTVDRLRSRLSADRAAPEFEEALEALLDRLARVLSERS